MQQVIQPVNGRATELALVPAPVCGPNQILIANRFSLVSAGTEKSTVNLARQSLAAKARSRPDHVRRVLQKIRGEGLFETIRQVRAKLAQPIPLGYSSAGVVIEVGENVREFHVGDRVASNGSHAGVVAVSKHLAAQVPANVELDRAAYAVIGAIALQGVRLAGVGIGDRVGVIGLGLIGQLAVAQLKAAGCVVIGTDVDPGKLALAEAMGADLAVPSAEFEDAALGRTGGRGLDAVLITASTASNGPIEQAARAARQKGKVVAVGAVGLNLPRRDFYPKELDFVVSCSYGPGRYDADYEDHGRDYPYARVRWTEQRNIEAVLEMMAAGRLPVERLTSHRFPIDRGLEAYELIETGRAPYVGILLEYPEAARFDRSLDLGDGGRPSPTTSPKSRRDEGPVGLTVIGTGGFVSSTLLPAFLADGGFRLAGTVSAAGLSALTLGRRYQAGFVATDAVAAIRDDRTEAAVIGTRHDSHAELVDAALRAGKPVFVEKPLAISEAQLAGLTETADELGDDLPPVMVGYNRRWSPLVSELKRHLGRVVEPKSLLLRMNAGPIPAEHWTQDPEVGGGRIVGEGCHAVDLAEAIIGAPITRVYAADVGPRARTAPLEDNVHLTLTHADGSVTTIIYASRGDRSAGKERVELFAGELTATIDDWRALEVHRRGKRIARLAGWSQRKGYAEEVRGFREAIRTGVSPTSLVDLIRTATVCLRALDSLRLGQPIDLGTN